jgi:hypothetical protein
LIFTECFRNVFFVFFLHKTKQNKKKKRER